jgi:hypothetical protein
MDLRTLTKLFLKLTGLYLLVTSALMLPGLLSVPSEYSGPGFVSAAIFTMIGFALIAFPGAITTYVVRLPPSETVGEPGAEKLLRIGSALMGVYFVADAVIRGAFVWSKARWFYDFMQPFPGSHGPGYSPEDFGTLAAALVQLIVGLVLWIGSRQIARISGRFVDGR